ncbi:hypothetical protein KQI41_00605 [Tissierella pigra]|uniref:Phage-Barnase-EndoU-ColicinE5/D-RelE like nuclease 4 domain-containing protein n=1 Tax=Tissierella pigra TaxID=2607614 RepID=A0A6N7XY28_9FIRM|nr:PBECR4 domain-containing protein [Tissierella pigra]MBU5424893.1 hypothetical protein [Tissierella pigra]MSU01168.1 hypothetical protein [Tissierella pigra]
MSLKSAALSFKNLLDIEYKIVVGRKGITTELIIEFKKENFFHLVGLQKLNDINYPSENKEKVFDLIIENQITESFISKSSKYEVTNIERITPFVKIEEIMDSNNLVFKFNRSQSNWTSVECKFILENIDSGGSIYIFIDGNYELKEKMFCRSFFLKTQKDFTNGNTKMVLLYKEKINKKTGEWSSVKKTDNKNLIYS